MLMLSLVDILLSFPVGLVSFIINLNVDPDIPFWPGWRAIHRSWEPVRIPARVWRADSFTRFSTYWNMWVGVVYAIAIAALFGPAVVMRLRNYAYKRVKRGGKATPSNPRTMSQTISDMKSVALSHRMRMLAD